MNIQEMHTTFRTLGQQMGMQLIRAVLPESIDVFINEAINEKVRNDVTSNVATQFNDRVAIQDNSISPINSIRTLSKRKPLAIVNNIGANDFYSVVMDIEDVMFYTSFGIRYPNIKKRLGTRFIESDKIDDTRRDYCNRESWDYPIITMFANDEGKEYTELYIDDANKTPTIMEVSYIELPAIVKWNANLANATNCNIPVGYHNEIVELAVNKFFNSVGYTTKQVAHN